jgi:hypothetical protein
MKGDPMNSQKKRLISSGLFLFFSLAMTPVSFAYEAGACKADADKLCAGATDREGRMKCMKDHQADLSPACQAEMQKMKEKFEAFKTDCGSDMQKYCSTAEDGPWAKRKCLQDHQADLTPACQAHLQTKK